MKLIHIKETKCKVCGSNTESETRNNPHCNGRYNEERTFACGRTVHYYPNYDKLIRTLTECPKSKTVVAEVKKREKLHKALNREINKSKVYEKYKKELQIYLRVH